MTLWDEFKAENNQNKAILVEGSTDKAAFTHFFDKKRENWNSQFEIIIMGNKNKVCGKLQDPEVAFGIVDKDTWDEEQIAKFERNNGGKLCVLPRYCLENYLVLPDEIWEALSANQKRTITSDNLLDLESISQNIMGWKKHAAMWKTIAPLRSQLFNSHFENALLPKTIALDFSDDYVKQQLQVWSDILDPETIFSTFQEESESFRTMDNRAFLKTFVHGKHFYHQEVKPLLHRLVGNFKENDLFRRLTPPEDLNFIFNRLANF